MHKIHPLFEGLFSRPLMETRMVAQYALEFKLSISESRLERYRKGGTDLNMLTNYF